MPSSDNHQLTMRTCHEWRHAQAPDAMRSLASALQLLTTALGSYVATAVTTIINSVGLTPHAKKQHTARLHQENQCTFQDWGRSASLLWRHNVC